MSHEVESMFYAGDTPWHGLGVYVGDENVDSKTAIEQAGLNWRVEKRPMFVSLAGQSVEVPSHRAMVRTSDDSLLGVVGAGYGIVQNTEAFDTLDALADDGSIRYHTAGSLRNGQRIFILAKFGSSEVVPGDFVDRFLFCWSTHDGTGSIRMLPTSVRVVCANTAKMALLDGRGEGMVVRHTSRALDRLAEAREALGFATMAAEHEAEIAKTLVRLPMSTDKWTRLLAAVVPENDAAKRHTRTDNIRTEILRLAEEGRGSDLPGVSGTGWGALQSVVEYVNYYRATRAADETQRQSNRFESSLFGSGAALIDSARSELLSMVA